MNSNFEIHPLTIEFGKVRYGLLHFTLSLGDQSFETRFSDVFDPYYRFKHWLEAIAVGVEQCSFSFDAEGPDYRFGFEQPCWNRCEFVLDCPYGTDVPHLKGNVERRQLVEAFYNGFLGFGDSAEFDRREWEVELIGERFCKAIKVDLETVIAELAGLSGAGLKEILFKIDPCYSVSYTNIPDLDNLKVYIETEYEGKDLPKGVEKVETPQEWVIPEDYDAWFLKRRTEFVERCLSNPTSGQSGTRLSELKSSIIDKYLSTGSG